jgi:hypothetical protein
VSGGSYSYLFAASDLEELQAKKNALKDMAERLAGLGYAADAAGETLELLLMLRQFDVNLRVRMKHLADVWHAVEWWDSCDSGEDRVHEALAAYRDVGTEMRVAE